MFPDNSSRAADIICVVFIFVYAFGYSLGFGPAAWLYGSEVSSSPTHSRPSHPSLLPCRLLTLAQIFPTSVRARGLNLSASAGSVGSVIVAQIWPVGVDVLGSNVYFIFMAVNIACIPVSSGATGPEVPFPPFPDPRDPYRRHSNRTRPRPYTSSIPRQRGAPSRTWTSSSAGQRDLRAEMGGMGEARMRRTLRWDERFDVQSWYEGCFFRGTTRA